MTMEVTTDQTTSTVTDSGHAVTVYGQPGCNPCRATTITLDRAGIPYHYVDASLDESVAGYLRSTYGPTTPVVEVKEPDTGQVQAAWSGYRGDSCKALGDPDMDPAVLDHRG